jgi:hypothetical protein
VFSEVRREQMLGTCTQLLYSESRAQAGERSA